MCTLWACAGSSRDTRTLVQQQQQQLGVMVSDDSDVSVSLLRRFPATVPQPGSNWGARSSNKGGRTGQVDARLCGTPQSLPPPVWVQLVAEAFACPPPLSPFSPPLSPLD